MVIHLAWPAEAAASSPQGIINGPLIRLTHVRGSIGLAGLSPWPYLGQRMVLRGFRFDNNSSAADK